MDKFIQKKAWIETRLEKNLPDNCPAEIYNAMKYSLLAGGKRLRPLLLLLAYNAYKPDGRDCECEVFACALEMIHTYSLIHDDLPAIDNDDLRRGKPSSHVMFGEAAAILAGDALLNLAYELMARAVAENADKNTANAMYVIAAAAGVQRLIGGQMADILSENKSCDKDTLLYIHKNKTAALFEAALASGAYLAGCGGNEIQKLKEIGIKLGLAFQIKDDILDETSTAEKLGKYVLSDKKNKKATYVSLYGLEKARADYGSLSEEILQDLEKLDCDKTLLREFIKQISGRSN